VYQAPSDEDVKSWIGAINNAIQKALVEVRDNIPAAPSPTPFGSTRKDIAAVLTGKSMSFSGHRQISNPNRSEAAKAVGRHATTGERTGYERSPSQDPASSALLQKIQSADEGNKVCADCGADSKVDWCSINLGVLLCIECSGIHRSLGTHISKVRSLVLDTSVFTPDLIEILLLIGNRVSNMVWEAKLDRFLKPSAHSTRDQRLHFITAKYSDRTYVQPMLGSQTPDDHLLTSIKKNDIQNVLHALALRANPNAHDRSRSTHAIFLALAAADPASPAGTNPAPGFTHTRSSSTSTMKPSPTSPNSRPGTPTRKPFPVAELLLKNGAEVPAEQAPIPLSQAAKQYIEFKNNQRLGRLPNDISRDPSGDQLSSLPNNLSPPGMSASERDRQMKRSSGGLARPSSSRHSLASGAIESFVKK
jgi:Arf-GAP/SH3 domain/ANK repeat/PH domain-containing protein